MKWNDPEATTDQKLEFLRQELIRIDRQSLPPLNPFEVTPTPLDKMIAEKEAKLKAAELEAAYKRIAELSKHRDDTDDRIKKIMSHSNNMMNKISAIEKMIAQMGR
jgi:hypothetical protein